MRGKQIRGKHKEKQNGKQNGKTKWKNKTQEQMEHKHKRQKQDTGAVKKRTKCGFQYWYLLRY